MGEEGIINTTTVICKMDSTVTVHSHSQVIQDVLIESHKESKNAICLLMEETTQDALDV